MGQEQYQIPVLTETETETKTPLTPTYQQTTAQEQSRQTLKQPDSTKISTNLLASKYKTNAQRLLVSLRASGFISTENGRDELTEKAWI
ncbi:hypothetical protein [Aliamphritea spongicola]|nr:hypothetical protein [Aliamphritea spongicola]